MRIRNTSAVVGIAIAVLVLSLFYSLFYGARLLVGPEGEPSRLALRPSPTEAPARQVGPEPLPGGEPTPLDRGRSEEARGATQAQAAADAEPAPRLRGQVVDGSGLGVLGATVWLGRPAGQAQPALDARSQPTEEEGRFAFDLEGLAGLMVLAVDHPDFEPFEQEPLQLGSLPPAPIRVELRPGSTVSGTLLDEAGRPVPQAQVHFEVTQASAFQLGRDILLMQTGGAFALRRLAVSDGEGRFRLGGLWPVTGVVVARAPDGRTAHSDEVRLDPRQPREIALRLAVGWTIEGSVRDLVGPIDSAVLVLSGERAAERRRLSYMELAVPTWRTRSDSDGRFRFDGLSPGTFVLEASARAYARRRFDVVLETHAWVDVLLDSAGAIAGEVEGILLGDPATLWLQAEDGALSHRREIRSTGSPMPFRIEDVPTGTFVLVAESPLRVGARSDPIEVAAGQVVEGVRLRLADAGGVRGTVRSARTGEPLAGARVSLFAPKEGRRVDDQVLSIPMFFIRQVADPMPREDAAVTDEAGRFVLPGVRPGKHSLLADHAEHAPSISDAFVVERADEWRELDLELFQGGFVAGSILTSAGKPVPEEWALMRALPAGEPFWRAQADVEGRYTFPRLPAGEYELALEPPRGSRQALEGQDPFLIFPTRGLRLKDGSRVDITLRRDPPGELSGRISSAAGEPVACHVILRQVRPGKTPLQSFSTIRWCRTDAFGDYGIDGLEPGAYLIDVMPELGTLPVRRQVEVFPEERASLDLALPAGEVRGQVRDASGGPIRGAVLRLRPEPADPQRFPAVRPLDGFEVFDPELPGFADLGPLGLRVSSSDAQGRFRLPFVPDGGFRLEVRHAEHGTQTLSLELSATRDPVLEVDVTLGADER